MRSCSRFGWIWNATYISKQCSTRFGILLQAYISLITDLEGKSLFWNLRLSPIICHPISSFNCFHEFMISDNHLESQKHTKSNIFIANLGYLIHVYILHNTRFQQYANYPPPRLTSKGYYTCMVYSIYISMIFQLKIDREVRYFVSVCVKF